MSRGGEQACRQHIHPGSIKQLLNLRHCQGLSQPTSDYLIDKSNCDRYLHRRGGSRRQYSKCSLTYLSQIDGWVGNGDLVGKSGNGDLVGKS